MAVCFIHFIEPAELHEHLSDDAGRRLPDNITGLEAMLNPNMEELAQIDNETLEVILKTDRNDETSPTSRMSNVVYCYLYTSVQCFISITFWVNEPEKLHTLKMLDSDNVLGNVLM